MHFAGDRIVRQRDKGPSEAAEGAGKGRVAENGGIARTGGADMVKNEATVTFRYPFRRSASRTAPA